MLMPPETFPLLFYGAALVVAIRLLFWLASRRRRRIRRLEDLLALTPAQFEEAIAALFRRMGYRSVERTGKAGDLAADIHCTDKAGRNLVVQCKRYAQRHRIGRRS